MLAHKVVLTTDEEVIEIEFVEVELVMSPETPSLLYPLDIILPIPRVIQVFPTDIITVEQDLHYQVRVNGIDPETHILKQFTLSGKGRVFCNNDTPEKIEILMLENPVKSVIELAEEVK
uniref:Uncharacterized protein n=1 Tax=viral metagenome TaxID=1070528 RepID=A0A6M3LTZ1_9ZZZZ